MAKALLLVSSYRKATMISIDAVTDLEFVFLYVFMHTAQYKNNRAKRGSYVFQLTGGSLPVNGWLKKAGAMAHVQILLYWLAKLHRLGE
jgi:hypothetical protein